ncbi:MAG: hypothetical protein GKR90_22805 [Pseudomonadales bacterium]|nr:hypothetical protein [Pseudomonadales bacterium]
MKIEAILNEQIAHFDLCPGATTIEQWSRKTWLETRIGERLVPIFPLWPIRDSLSKHDIHHVLTGYHTDIRGESELAAWELGSGGCHLNIIFWIDRVSFFFIGLLTFPIATLRAMRRGIQCRNLFSRQMDAILDAEVEDIQRELKL